MDQDTIKVNIKEKSTTIRLSETTKRMLEALASGKESHEQILLRLIKLANTISSDSGSKVVQRQNMIGTKYERIHKTLNIELGKHRYSVVCVYNDLTLFALFRINKKLENYNPNNELPKEWEVDLEIVNIKKDNGEWKSPPPLLFHEKDKNFNKREYVLLYLIALKKILEDIFDVKFYKISKEEDYFNSEKWEESYKLNNLSIESFDSDVQKKIHEVT